MSINKLFYVITLSKILLLSILSGFSIWLSYLKSNKFEWFLTQTMIHNIRYINGCISNIVTEKWNVLNMNNKIDVLEKLNYTMFILGLIFTLITVLYSARSIYKMIKYINSMNKKNDEDERKSKTTDFINESDALNITKN